MNSNGRPKLAVLFHRLGPYHHARLASVTAQRDLTEENRFSLVTVQGCSMDRIYAWDKVNASEHFTVVTLFQDGDSNDHPKGEVLRRMTNTLSQINPAIVVVPGWTDSIALTALLWCGSNQVPAICMSESTEWDAKRSSWREAVKRRIVGLCSAALVGGRPHKEYIVKLGMPAERVFAGYDAVDNRYFTDKAEEARKQKIETRKKHHLPENYFLASARFVEQKNLPRLLEAYALYRKQSLSGNPTSSAWDLVLLGDGPLRAELCRLISALRLGDCVHLPGFKQYGELPVYYGLAGAFVHASTMEPWGLVVNEAMASGLPVLVSNRCGCAPDLVQEGVNGFTFDPSNAAQMAEMMLRLASISGGENTLERMGEASRQIIGAWGPERFAQGLLSAAETALKHPGPRLELLDRVLLRGLMCK
jgi:glycosyltransferase involved in cell wall biosynthesis